MHKNNLLRKGLVVGIFILFIVMSVIPSSGKIYVAASRTTIYDGSLSGYVNDTSMNPIEGALVRVYFHETYEENYSDEDGYYHVTNIPICYCFKNATCSIEGYKTEWVLLGIVEDTTHDFIMTSINNPSWPPPSGPNRGIPGEEYTFCIDLPINPDCEPYFVMWDWGDGDYSGWLGPYKAGETVCANHSWNETGTYEIRVKIRDSCDDEYWSDPLVIRIGNDPPNTPEIEGKRRFKVGEGGEHPYTIYSTDPDGDYVCYLINWSDGTQEWFGFYKSGEEITMRVTIPLEEGTYVIFKIKAEDIFGAESDWAILEVTVSRNKEYINTPFQWFLQQHPNQNANYLPMHKFSTSLQNRL